MTAVMTPRITATTGQADVSTEDTSAAIESGPETPVALVTAAAEADTGSWIAITLDATTPAPSATWITPNAIRSAGPEIARAATRANPARLSAERSGAAVLPGTESAVSAVSVPVTARWNHSCVQVSRVRALARMLASSVRVLVRRGVMVS